jgi:hypothetical protein
VSSPHLSRFSIVAAVAAILIAARAAAQPAPGPTPAPAQPPAPAPSPSPDAAPAAPPPPLAQIRDDKQLAEALSSITQDPAVAVDNPATRPLAQALMTEGVKQLKARAYDQALANFLEAYAKFPSPKILLNIASTLRDMGRLADAANTYQRYLTDPATGAERVGEVKDLLIRLDDQLTILTLRVSPRGSDISIDGGPFVTVGSTLVTRVRTGLHLVRIRKEDQANEVTINGFDGENKEVATRIAPEPSRPMVAEARSPEIRPSAKGARPAPARPVELKAPEPAPDRVDGWLITGTQYGASDGNSRERRVRSDSGRELSAIVPHDEVERAATAARDEIDSGAIGVVRIDGKGRGFAGGVGLAISRGSYELEVMGLKSDLFGAYLGFRYRLLTGFFRPYLGGGVPSFVYDHDETVNNMTTTSRRVAVGLRAAGGLEIKINGHLSVQGDVGYEHFFFVDSHFEANVFVPTVGVIGRL